MLKWILGMVLIYTLIWWYISVNSSYKPISQQIDVKTMSVKNLDYIERKWDTCVGSCKNRSSSTSTSSWWGSSYGGK
jgi:hypothetical protein